MAQSQLQWKQLPGPEGGQMTQIEIKPNGELFSYAKRGGYFYPADRASYGTLYFSSDHAESWVNLGNPALPFETMTIGPNGFIYASSASTTGSEGLLQSTDNGLSWEIIREAPRNLDFISLISFDDQGRMYIATGDSGVFRSTDYGSTWEHLLGGGNKCIFKSQHDNIFGTTTNGYILRSTDDGVSWESSFVGSIPNTIPNIVQNDIGYLFAGYPPFGVLRSNDEGGTWDYVNNGLLSVGFAPLLRITKNQTLILIKYGGDGSISRSINNGDTWLNIPFPHLAYDIATDSLGYVYVSSSDGIYFSADDGVTWMKKSKGILSAEIYALTSSSNGVLFAGGHNCPSFRSTDNGVTWEDISLNFDQSSNILNSFASHPWGKVFAGFLTSGSNSTVDNGETWQLDSLCASNFGCGGGVRSISISPWGDIFLGAETGGKFYRSTNYGLTWIEKRVSNEGPITSFCFGDNGDIYFGTYVNRGIYRSQNNGVSFTQVSTFSTGSIVTGLSFDSQGRLIATTGDFYYLWITGGIYRSNDSGLTWSRVDKSLPPASYYSLLTDSKIGVLVASDSGAYRSTDGGDTWELIKTGLAQSKIHVFSQSVAGNIYAGTDGGGVYQLVDGTQSVILSDNILGLPKKNSLLQNYPNPFNSVSVIRYSVSKRTRVKLEIIDILGRVLRILTDEVHNPDIYTVTLSMEEFGSGIYMYRMTTENEMFVRKMIHLR